MNNYERDSMKVFKVLFIGGCGVGAKTSLINNIMSYSFNEFEVITLIPKFFTKRISTPSGEVSLDLWDSCGQEKLRPLLKFYKDSDYAILGYDITSKNSFDEIKNYFYNEIKSLNKDALIYLVGNKIDLYERRYVTKEEGLAYSKEKA